MEYTIDFEGLKHYLENINADVFEQTEGRNCNDSVVKGFVKKAKTINEINHFKTDKSKITLDRVIFYGMPFLCDVLGNDLSIIELTKRSYKQPNGRVIPAKFIKTIIPDCHKIYGTALNGYWVIPELFIKYSN